MDAAGLLELFAPIGPIHLKRMFSGHAVFTGDLCFALALRGEVYMKVDAETRDVFAAVGSRPFTYEKAGREVRVAYWLLPAEAFDDFDELRRWSDLALAAARRAAERKGAGKRKRREGVRKS
jgi:DNA transformation protein and related proteins